MQVHLAYTLYQSFVETLREDILLRKSVQGLLDVDELHLQVRAVATSNKDRIVLWFYCIG